MAENKTVPILIGTGITIALIVAFVLAKKPEAPPEEYSVEISNINISGV